jgi:autotransporter passenger strand-loop-strand repeat protein
LTSSISGSGVGAELGKSGGTLDVEAGYVLNGFAIAKGAMVDVLSGGIASGTIVSSGGMVDVFAGGTASGRVAAAPARWSPIRRA